MSFQYLFLCEKLRHKKCLNCTQSTTRVGGRIRKPPKRFGYDEFADLVTVEHYASV